MRNPLANHLTAEKIIATKLAAAAPPETAGFPRRQGGREPRTQAQRPPQIKA